MSKEVTFDILELGEDALPVAREAVSGYGVEVTREGSMGFPFRKAQISVSGQDSDVDAAYEAVVAAFPGHLVKQRTKEFPWHWEHLS